MSSEPQRLYPPLYYRPLPPIPKKKLSFKRDTRNNNGLYNTEVTTIQPHELTDPFGKTHDCRGSIVKKCLKYSIDVACIPITIPDDNFSKIQDQLTILEKLRDSSNILKFYGLSRFGNQLFMIFEWAELGNLLEVSIAFGICRGISFLNSCLILHHDIRCANIMMTPHLEPKITNFRYAIDKNKINNEYYESVSNVDDIINWMAPEKILNSRYNEKCEMFSFGMLLWELAFEIIPYKGWDVQRIKNHVLNNHRENLNIKLNNEEKLQESYFKIIKNTWHHNPQERSNLQSVLLDLDKLVSNYHQNGFSQKDKAIKWIEGAIKQRVIKSIGWSELKFHERVGAGNFGTVFKAFWPNIHNYVVYKKLLISSDIQFKIWEAFKHELQIQSRAHDCENIIRVLGISKRDLSLYLSNNFEKLDWNKKFRLALDITNGLHYLHKENILHRDLHARNIVIHQGKAKITDFGNSKSMNTMTKIHDHIFGNISYIAPEVLRKKPYTKYSDIYSLGVLLWELSSGKPPFKTQVDYTIVTTILSGNREERMPDTPNEYYELYNECWDDRPERRHKVEYVYDVLEKLLLVNNDDVLVQRGTQPISIPGYLTPPPSNISIMSSRSDVSLINNDSSTSIDTSTNVGSSVAVSSSVKVNSLQISIKVCSKRIWARLTGRQER
ncbi:19993_t:CDS:2 [Funneliformis geosporum]|nr:19993_t:CDS:2 [Funneliformis geosporum]